MFLVRFFASSQYFWTHHGRVIAFTEECAVIRDDKKYRSNPAAKQSQALYTQGTLQVHVYITFYINYCTCLHYILHYMYMFRLNLHVHKQVWLHYPLHYGNLNYLIVYLVLEALQVKIMFLLTHSISRSS